MYHQLEGADAERAQRQVQETLKQLHSPASASTIRTMEEEAGPAQPSLEEEAVRHFNERAEFIESDPGYQKSRYLQGMALSYRWAAHWLQRRAAARRIQK